MLNSIIKLLDNSRFIRGIIAAVFLLPLTYTPSMLYPYHFGKWMLVYLVLFVVVFLLAIKWVKKGSIAISRHPLFITLCLFIVARIIFGIIGANPVKSFWGDALRLTGTWVWIPIFIGAWALTLWLQSNSRRLFVLRTACISALIAAVFGWLVQFAPQVFGVEVGTVGIRGRFAGLFGSPAYFAAFIMTGIFFALGASFLEKRSKWRLMWLGSAAFLFITLVITQTRAGIIGAVLGIGVAGIAWFCKYSNVQKSVRFAGVFIVGIIALITAYGFVAHPLEVGSRFRLLDAKDMYQLIKEGGGIGTRLLMWESAFSGISDRPLLGWGPENYELVLDKWYQPRLLDYAFEETWAERAHNQILENFVGMGIIGGLLYLSIFFVAFVTTIRHSYEHEHERLAAIAMLGLIAAYFGFAFFTFDMPSLLLHVFAGSAIIASFASRRVMWILPQGLIRVRSLINFGFIVVFVMGLWHVFFIPLREARVVHQARIAFFTNSTEEYSQLLDKGLFGESVFRIDSLKNLSDDLINNAGSGDINEEVIDIGIKSVLTSIESEAQERTDVFTIYVRYAQMLSLAAQHIDEDQYKAQAHKAFAHARGLSPGRQVVDLSEAELYLAFDEIDKARVIADRLVKENPENARVYWLKSLVLYGENEKKAAGDAMSKAIELGFRIDVDAKGLEYVLEVLEEAGHYNQIVYVLKIITHEGSFVASQEVGYNFLRLAYTLANLGRFEEARSEAVRALELDPELAPQIEEFISTITELESDMHQINSL